MYGMEALMRNVYKKIRLEMNIVYDNELSRNEFFVLKILYEHKNEKIHRFIENVKCISFSYNSNNRFSH